MWKTLPPIASKTGRWLCEDRAVAADEHRDLADGSEVDAAGDRRLERVDAARRRDRGEALELVAVVRARVDPRPSRREPGEDARLAR